MCLHRVWFQSQADCKTFPTWCLVLYQHKIILHNDSWHGNTFHITHPLWGESTSEQWMASNEDLFMFYLLSTSINCWKKLLSCHCLRCHATHVNHYNIVTVKQSHFCVTQWVSTWELQGRDNGCRNPPWFQNAHANGPFITDMTRMPSH